MAWSTFISIEIIIEVALLSSIKQLFTAAVSRSFINLEFMGTFFSTIPIPMYRDES